MVTGVTVHGNIDTSVVYSVADCRTPVERRRSLYPAGPMTGGLPIPVASKGSVPGMAPGASWPPPVPGSPAARDLFAIAARKDPLGDRVHFWMAVVTMAVQPVHPIPAAIGQAVVIVYALLRIHATWRGALPLLRSPLVVVSILIPLWTGIAIAWSSAPEVGFEDILPLRFPLFALCLWPLRDRAWPLLLALASGCAVQAVAQASMFVGLVPNLNEPYDAWEQTGGLGKHPGNTALFAAVTLPILLGRALVVETRRGMSAVLFLAGASSVVFAGNRTHFLVVPVALVMAVLRVVVTRRFLRARWRSMLAAGIGGVLMLAAVPLVAPDSLVVNRVNAMIREVERAVVDGEYESSSGLRLYWWRESVGVMGESPIFGHGTGSTRPAMQAYLAGIRGPAEAARFATDNPHSTLVSEGIERGAIGILLWGGLAVLGLIGARRVSNIEPWLTGLPAAWLILIGYGLSSSVQLSGINTAVLAILLFLTLPPPIPPPLRPEGPSGTDPGT